MSNEIILNADARLRTGTNKNREIRREIQWFLPLYMGIMKIQKYQSPLNEIQSL